MKTRTRQMMMLAVCMIWPEKIKVSGRFSTPVTILPDTFSSHLFIIESDATDVVPGDTNGLRDVFFRDRGVMLPGDLNGDHLVNQTDVDIMMGVFGTYDPCPSHIAPDLDRDCQKDKGVRKIFYAGHNSS